MRRKILFVALLGVSVLSVPALADEDCRAPMSTWQPRSAVAAKAESLGMRVRRIRTDDGCYKVYGQDEQGRRIEAEFDPETLELLELEIETGGPDEDDSEHGEGDEQGDDHGLLEDIAPLVPLVILPAEPVPPKPATAAQQPALMPLIIPHSTPRKPKAGSNPLIGAPKAVVN
jgi:hypothetical protein